MASGAWPSSAPWRQPGAGFPPLRALPAATATSLAAAAQPAAAEEPRDRCRGAPGLPALPHAPARLWHEGAGHRFSRAQDRGASPASPASSLEVLRALGAGDEAKRP